MRFALAVLLAVAPAVGRAQGLFADDFESFQILQPSGVWLGQTALPNSEVSIVPSAAHRGDAGFRSFDGDATGTPQVPAWAFAQLAGQPITSGDVYLRFWFRLVSAADDAGSFVRIGFLRGSLSDGGALAGGGADGIVNVFVHYPSGLLRFEGYNNAQQLTADPSDAGISVGAWHLVEQAVLGVNTDAGERRFWLDGRLVSASSRAYGGVYLYGCAVGESWTVPVDTLVGIFDYDDVRSSSIPPASAVVVSMDAGLATGACAPMTIALRDSSGQPAPAPYDFVANASVSGVAGAFFTDPACSSSAPGAAFAAGNTVAGPIYFRATSSGTALVSGTYVDFLSAPTAAAVTGPVQLDVACDCSAGAGGPLLVLALVWSARRKRH